MKKIIFSLIACMTFIAMEAKVVKGYKTTTSTGSIELIIDSIDFRKDLIRVYGKLKGVPHTSNRIDNMTLKSGKKIAAFTDIDGVDARRWFQWEDTGLIPVEIDFPPYFKSSTAMMMITTEGPKGNSSWTIKRINQKR